MLQDLLAIYAPPSIVVPVLILTAITFPLLVILVFHNQRKKEIERNPPKYKRFRGFSTWK